MISANIIGIILCVFHIRKALSIYVEKIELYEVSNMFSGGLYVNESKDKDRR